MTTYAVHDSQVGCLPDYSEFDLDLDDANALAADLAEEYVGTRMDNPVIFDHAVTDGSPTSFWTVRYRDKTRVDRIISVATQEEF